ncbi:MAG: transporter substrate-binding domain-containing protein [Undibacterium sp.]|nr:transporter substrate-binding domain-containing protein [Opitutaceae bacterium]
MRAGSHTLLILVCLVIVGPARAQPAPAAPRPPMRFGIEAEASPLSFAGPDGNPVGYSVELVAAISREMGFPAIYVQAPWEKLYAQFQAGELDVLPSLAYTAERDRFIDYSVPHLVLHGAAFVRSDGPSLRTNADLRNLRVGVQRDSFSEGFLRQHGWNVHPIYIDTLREGLQAVADNHCDAVLAVGLVGKKIIRELKLTNVVISDVPFPEFNFNLHLGVHAGDADRLALINAGLARIIANGTYDAIYEKWIGPLQPRAVRIKDIQLYLTPGLIIVLGLSAAFAWQRRVLRKVRAQAEALRASEERLKLVLEVGAHGLWDYDHASDRAAPDPWMCALTGYTLAEIAADPSFLRRRVHPVELPRIAASDSQIALRGRDDVIMDYRVQTKTGDWRWVSSRGKVIVRNPDGSPLRSIGTNTDITELKHQEAERTQIHAKMLEAQKLESLGVLAGGIAHDFNNLLAVILGNAGLAKLALPPSNTEAVLSLTQIETASRRASDLCRQMLAYAGHGSHVRERVALSALTTNTTELLRLSIGKGATLTFDLVPGAPWVEADRSQLQQVVMNLVINASEALGPGPGSIRLATGHGTIDPAHLTDVVYRPEKIAGAYAWVEVADTGHGMTPETRAKIFEPFFTTKFTGRGLGLAAVLGIVRAHGGVFTLHSEVGRGSTFRIYLPAADPAALFAPAPEHLPVSLPAPAAAVLVADDEPTVLLMVTKTLGHQGYRVVTAADGREAVHRFATEPGAFCAVILDLTMPVLDGARALREIRALDPAAHLLVMSGYGRQETLAKLRDAGRVDFLPKPFTTVELLTALARVRQTGPA